MSRFSRHLLVLTTCTALAGAGALAAAPAALADGPTTFSNAAAIAIPNGSSPDQSGIASPYPSSIAVSGMSGAVTNLTAAFTGFSHSIASDVDAMLVAPGGASLLLMSDIGEQTSFTFASNVNLVFSDSGGSFPASGAISSGTYKPTDIDPGGAPDTFPSPAPAPGSQTTLAGAFTGINPNGTWSLYIVDDATGDTGSISGGWSLTITTTAAAASTSTHLDASPSPAQTGSPVTLTATVTSSGSPVTTGTVSFTEGATVIASGVALNASGQATTVTSSLAEGTHTILATYSGASGFISSSGSASVTIDNPTVINGTTYCNTGAISIPDSGIATPYASHITVSGLTTATNFLTVSVNGLSHTAPIDIDMMLVGPGGQNIELMSDVGGFNSVSGANLTFADGAGAVPSSSLSSGTYAPTNDTTDGADTFPAPAPSPSGATALATFANTISNGTWSLYVVDDATADSGAISGGWCVAVTPRTPTTTHLTAQPGLAAPGGSTTLTATVTASGSPVTVGDVYFYDSTGSGAVPLGSAPLDGSGTASIDAGLTAGRHWVSARYHHTTAFAASRDNRVRALVQPVADAGGPYSVVEGNPLHLDASGSTLAGSTFAWDINGDGSFADASGVTPTLSWDDLQALGLSAGNRYLVTVRVIVDRVRNQDRASLAVKRAPATLNR